MKKIALFADVQNLYYTVRQAHGCHFNYAALWAEVSAAGQIVEAYAYAIDRGDPKQRQFQQILRNLGFEVRLKPFIQRSDGSAKGDWDVGICIDVLDAAPRVDEVVLASGGKEIARGGHREMLKNHTYYNVVHRGVEDDEDAGVGNAEGVVVENIVETEGGEAK